MSRVVLWRGAFTADGVEGRAARVLEGITIEADNPGQMQLILPRSDRLHMDSVRRLDFKWLEGVGQYLEVMVDRKRETARTFFKLLFCNETIPEDQKHTSLALLLSESGHGIDYMVYGLLEDGIIRLKMAPFPTLNTVTFAETGTASAAPRRPPMVKRGSSTLSVPLRQAKLVMPTSATPQLRHETAAKAQSTTPGADVVRPSELATEATQVPSAQASKSVRANHDNIGKTTAQTPSKRKRDPCETFLRNLVEQGLQTFQLPKHSDEGRKVFDRTLKGTLFALRHDMTALVEEQGDGQETKFLPKAVEVKARNVVNTHLSMYVAQEPSSPTHSAARG